MYAVIRAGGKQHRVEPGGRIRIERVEGEIGSTLELGEVLLVEKDGAVTVGEPLVSQAMVRATILDQDRAKKIIVFKKKRKKQYRRTRGHRQDYTELRVDEISL